MKKTWQLEEKDIKQAIADWLVKEGHVAEAEKEQVQVELEAHAACEDGPHFSPSYCTAEASLLVPSPKEISR